ncbi:MAG: DNA mismatch repair protein MutS [Phycisphaerales bacterium]|nr:DNA mismatch repair protein MutS [Phycisphaerales bacterium]
MGAATKEPNRDTPAMRQYRAFKAQHPGCVLLFRMGDFYELFDEDAVTISKALGLTLTERSAGIPMAGMPHHSAEGYIRRLVEQGFRVVVADQIEDPKQAKGIVERAVTRVITPGTLIDEPLLDDTMPSVLGCVAFLDAGDAPDARASAAVIELSTGRFGVFACKASDLVDELTRRGVRELLCAQNGDGELPARAQKLGEALGVPMTGKAMWQYRRDEALEALKAHFGVTTLAGFGLQDDDEVVLAAGVILRHLRETYLHAHQSKLAERNGSGGGNEAAQALARRSLAHIGPPMREDAAPVLRLDATSLRALEVERTVRGGASEGSLLGLFLHGRGVAPKTAMGRRLLREWLCAPPVELQVIEARHAAVSTLLEDHRAARELGEALNQVQDLPRIGARVSLGRATPRDIVAMGRSLGAIGAVAQAIEGAPALTALRDAIEQVRTALEPIAERVQAVCVDTPPAHMREGGLIRDGIDQDLDEARSLRTKAGEWLSDYQAKLVEEHDLPSLKVGYNKVFGYYIELPAAQAKRAPSVFTRKQTLKNAERYITPELKGFEDKVLHAEDRAVARELALFLELCDAIGAQTAAIRALSEALAALDVLLTFAMQARKANWTRPTITEDSALAIEQGRHPVLEAALGGKFVPNDLALGAADAPRLALITGPNMAGKSTYIRQVALIVILAHAGSFVPAASATVGLTDRLFTRIGADDALHQGQSTFMVEMIETARILHGATARSLIVLDEVGRGTSTLDGLSLAWAITEHLSGIDVSEDAQIPRALFATHYHELTELADQHPARIQNLHVAVKEWTGPSGEPELVFLHRIEPGRSNRSFGVHVARLAGIPRNVVDRAATLLDSLSVSHDTAAVRIAVPASPGRGREQMSLFTEFVPHPVIEEIKQLDLARLSPMEAFDRLRAMAKQIER